MTIARLSFPQFPRLFSAPILRYVFGGILMAGYWSVLGILIALNIPYLSTLTHTTDGHIFTVIRSPLSSAAHQKLATYFWNENLHNSALQELELAQSLLPFSRPGVLGASTSPADTLKELESVPALQTAEYTEWLSVISQKPDYRDAYVKAAEAAIRLGKTQEAERLLQTALQLDPNYTVATRLLTSLTTQ